MAFAKEILENCTDEERRNVKFLFGNKTKSSKIVEIFNLTPENETFEHACWDSNNGFLCFNNSIVNDDHDMKLHSNVKLIEISTDSYPATSIYKFLADCLHKNTIKEHVFHFAFDKYKSRFSKETKKQISQFFFMQQSIKKLKTESIDFIEVLYELSSDEIKFEFLEELILEGEIGELIPADIFTVFPNLKILTTSTTQKTDAFAKFLPKLENLSINYSNLENFKFCELDSEFVHENLNTLHILSLDGNFCAIFEEFLKIFKIFPNLEFFSFIFVSFKSHSEYNFKIDKNFFIELNKAAKIKHLLIDGIPLRHSLNDFEFIASELIELSKKIYFFWIGFFDLFDDDEHCKGFSYEALEKRVTKIFSIYTTENWSPCSDPNCYHAFTMTMSSYGFEQLNSREN